MRYTLAPLALAAVLPLCAHAQGSVTLFGMLDAGISYVSNESGHSNVKADDSVWTPSIWGLRGTEDLGAGYKAVFELASQFSVYDGKGIPGPSADFNRQAFVGLSKDGLGKLTFGQQYNLMADFLFFPPVRLDGTFTYGGLYNMRQGPFAALGIPNNPTGAFDFDQTAGTSRVSNAVKLTSESFGGLRVGALYGFGETPGSASTGNTVGFGLNYLRGGFAFGAAYNETKYAQLNNGRDGIRNAGAGIGQQFGDLFASALYTYTRNTLTGATVQVAQVGGLYALGGAWHLGANYQYMKGNATLDHNRAQQVTGVVQYAFSKRTTAYVEAVGQWTGGDVAGGHNAWINGTAPSSSTTQIIGRVGLQHMF